MKRLRATLVFLLAISVVTGIDLMQPYGVSASCAVTPSLSSTLTRSPIVFVGTVISTRNESRTAVVRVTDIWRGKYVQRRVIVYGSYVTGHAATSVDRYFRKGITYLFVPQSNRRRSPFIDNICTATRRYKASLAKYRPRGAHRP